MKTIQRIALQLPEFRDEYDGSKMRYLVQELERLHQSMLADVALQFQPLEVTTTPVTVAREDIILVDDDTVGGAVTINLPPAIGRNQERIYIKKLGSTLPQTDLKP